MKLLGIDFGTCYIKCFDVEEDELKPLDTLLGGETSDRMANVITYENSKNYIVGEPNFFQKKDDVIVTNIKSNLVKKDWNVKLSDGNVKNAYEIVKDIFSYLYGKLRTDRPDVKEYSVVITTPVNFSKRQKEIVRKSANSVGFHVRDVISEPFASIFYLMKDHMDSKHNVLVVDIGGGTLDMCLAKIDGTDRMTVITESVNGMNFGGNTVDDYIVNYLMKRNKELEETLTRNTPEENAYNKLKLKYEIKGWKNSIFDEDFDEDDENRQSFFYSPYKGQAVDISISADELKKLLEQKGIKEKFFNMLDNLFDNSDSLVCDDITDIFMTGGTTMIPYFEEYVKEYFVNELDNEGSVECLFELNNELEMEVRTVGAVAQGAGLYNLNCLENSIAITNNNPTQIYTKTKNGKKIAKCNLEQTKYNLYTPEYGLVKELDVRDGKFSVFQAITIDVDEVEDIKEEVFIGNILIDNNIKNNCECFCFKCDVNEEIYAEFGNYEGAREESKFVPQFTSPLEFEI